MGYPTKIQLIKRKQSEQWYINFPAQIAQAMEFERGEIVEWVIEDKGLLVLKRRDTPPSALKKNGERRLTDAIDELWNLVRPAFGQTRTWLTAKRLMFSLITCLGRRTITGLICAQGTQYCDWSKVYRLFERERFQPHKVFSCVQPVLCRALPDNMPVIAALDDTLLRKSGKKIAGDILEA